MHFRTQLILILLLALTLQAYAAENRCEVTRFGLAHDALHPTYADRCVCASALDGIKADHVSGMRLAAACDVHSANNKLAGAFYYIGKITISGVVTRETDRTSPELITDIDLLTFRIQGGSGAGWPVDIDLSPGYERPEFSAPELSLTARCWRASGSMDVNVVRVLVDVRNGLIEQETWNGFFPIATSNIWTGPYSRCK